MKTLLIICSVLLLFCKAEESCKTRNQKDGKCVPLQQCSPLIKIVKNYQTATRADLDSLRQAQCKMVGNTPWVCCEEPSFKESDFPAPGICGTQIKERIVGGEETSITDYPWLALIEYTKDGGSTGFLCGGSLINKNYVITAAHCINGRSLVQTGWKPTSVRLGEHDLTTDRDCEDADCAPPVIDVNIAETIVHEAYEPSSTTQYNDIAMIRLAQPVSFSDFVKPICLPFAQYLREKSYDNVLLSTCGFGRTENGTNSNVKLKVEIEGFNWNRCNNLYNRALNPTQLCAGGQEGKDTCNGDSGGPLMGDHRINTYLPISYLVGIVSRGPQVCGTPGFPAIYSRVDKFLFWIRQQMRH